jgi:hypothetical protein
LRKHLIGRAFFLKPSCLLLRGQRFAARCLASMILAAGLACWPQPLLAQQQNNKTSKSFIVWTPMDYYDVSATVGRFLPFGVVGVRDNYPMWSVSGGVPSALGIVELDYGNFRANGVVWHQGSLGLRWDFDIFTAVEGYFGFRSQCDLLQAVKNRAARVSLLHNRRLALKVGRVSTGHRFVPASRRLQVQFEPWAERCMWASALT